MAERRYTQTVIKTLFGASGNQCAYPDCTNPIIAPETAVSDAAVVGQICHIYAAADNGPRGKPDLSDDERNSASNLILMCGHHHPIVDKQWADYPADRLIAWKKHHEAKFQQGTSEAIKRQEQLQQVAFARAVSDQEIDKELDRVRKGRFFNGFQTESAVIALATRVERSELAGGSSEQRARALAWCARLLAITEAPARTLELLHKSRELAVTIEADIAEAFLIATNDKAEALSRLARIAAPSARSAALRIVTNHDGPRNALAWAEKAGLSLASFDAEGKFCYASNQAVIGQWDDLILSTAELTDDDLSTVPILLHVKALGELVQVVPMELRSAVASQIPFDAANFPLSGDTEHALTIRRTAASYFKRVAAFAESIAAAEAAHDAADHALWLKLRDPIEHANALDELRASMRDDKHSLRRVPLALQFGLKVDLDAIERKINESTALAGKGTSDGALARLALALAKGSPKAAAEYIAAHRSELYEHLHKTAVVVTEIEMLARAGLKDAAECRLVEESASLSERERQHLERLIAEAAGADPSTERRKQFEQTGSITDLINLVRVLEENEDWRELCVYADRLFSLTHSLEDGFRFARCLDETSQHDRLLALLSTHAALVEQSEALKALLAWSLYRDGQFDAATRVLTQLLSLRDSSNDRRLRVEIAIASGQWHDLIEHTTNEWRRRDSRTGPELLAAGELARSVGGPHARDLITSAAEKAPDDPAILVGAYLNHMHAGWEESETTAQWLRRAASLSGEGGPVKSVSIEEVVNSMPEWTQHEVSVWDKLNAGLIPAFGAAHMLNKSLINLTLVPSLANTKERDVRRRMIIHAYSGARAQGTGNLKHGPIAVDLTALITFARLGILGTIIRIYEIVIPHSTLGRLFSEAQRAAFHQPSRIRDAHTIKRLIADEELQVLRTRAKPDDSLAKDVGEGLAALLRTVQSNPNAESGAPRYVIRSAPVHRVGSLLEEDADLSAYAPYLRSCHAVVEKLRAKGVLTRPEEQRALDLLRLHERRWPNEEEIADDAELCLDDLSVTHLRNADVLERMKAAGLKAYVTEELDAEANQLISIAHLAGQRDAVVDVIRDELARGLKAGRVRVVRSTRMDENERVHAALAVLSLESDVEALVVDDRFVNRFSSIDVNERKTPILTSLDILGDLAARGAISIDDWYAYRTALRQAGFQLIDLTPEELLHHLDNAPAQDGHVLETAELRAIRESLLRARMSRMLQLPLEAPWLQRISGSLVECIRRLWKKHSIEKAKTYADWPLKLLDARGWAPAAPHGGERSFALFSHAAQVLSLMTAPSDVADDVKSAYHAWLDELFVKQMKESQPEAFAWMTEGTRELVVRGAAEAADKLGG